MNDITTHEGYMARFWELVTEKQDHSRPHLEAWRSLENELFEHYGLRRYHTYGSFKTAKYKSRSKPQLRSQFHAKRVGHPYCNFVAQE
mgnify:FL=1